MSKSNEIIKELKGLSDPFRAKILKRFFKTGPGEYGEGDVFWGIKMPELRVLTKKYFDIPYAELTKLLKSTIHEQRMAALLVLTGKYKKSDEKEKEKIYRFYLRHTAHINNWDLVDATCGHIVGDYLLDKHRDDLYELARSEDLWERRIAIVSTYVFIKKDDFWDTFEIARILLSDKHDLIHKAVGWMLREVGKRDRKALEIFLRKYYEVLPRTTLRYAIERFPEKLRKKYLNKEINIISNL